MAAAAPVVAKTFTAPVVAKASAASIIQTWASELTPRNAPNPKHKGPLAWVRDEKVAELTAELAKAGYK